jgi:SAM-dependent methyltransferase
VACAVCGLRFPMTENIPQLFWPHDWDASKGDVTEAMKQFYEKTPFPNYDDFDNAGSLVEKARRGLFARLLDEQIPFGSRVVECGCGTGQLSNFLSVANRTVIGADMCLNSLRLAQGFKERNQLNRVTFIQMNLFRPVLKPGSFDLVISNGVLHHTADPFLAFQKISTLVKPNGYILIGLYHTYGRLLTDFRRALFRINRKVFEFADSRLTDQRFGATRRETWFADQYQNPHESKHTISEVIGWFSRTGFEFINSIPKPRLGSPFSVKERLFRQENPGYWLELLVKEVLMTFTHSQDGGLFIVIGKKKA